jgi:PAS domain S-box-containing protein
MSDFLLSLSSIEEQLAKRALRHERALLASVLENLPLGVGVYDDAGVLIHSNQRLRDYAGLARLPSTDPDEARRWQGFDASGAPIAPGDYPGARALRGERAMPGTNFLYTAAGAPARWMRISAIPFSRDGDDARQAIVVVQDVDDLKRASERIESAAADLASQRRFLEATLSSIPDYVYAFDRERRFVYANPPMLGLFGLSADEFLGKTLAELNYPPDLTGHLNDHVDRIFGEGATIEDEVFYESPTGHAAFFGYMWGPVHADDGSVELVVGVSRETSERRAIEQEIRRNAARLRAASDLVGLGIYSWDPSTQALDWDQRVRAMWGLSPDAPVDMSVYEAGIHPDDLPRVRQAIAACVDPAGDGRYAVEYRVIGRDDGITRHIATAGQTTFEAGRASFFIGAAIDMSELRRNEAAVRASEAQFRSFAAHTSNLLWIADVAKDTIIYRSAAFERIWGEPRDDVPVALDDWMEDVHPDDRTGVARALRDVKAGEVSQYEYRIVRPGDGGIRWLRDTSFPIRDDDGAVTRIGGIAEDVTQGDDRQIYLVSTTATEARRLARLLRAIDHRVRIFDTAAAFLDIAPVLAPGCVIIDLRRRREDGLSILRELRARAIALPAITLDDIGTPGPLAVAAMKAGAVDYLWVDHGDALPDKLAAALAECQPSLRQPYHDESASAQITRLTPREREVLGGLVEGGTNKTIAQKLGISPRTVELHRAQVMSKLGAATLPELMQVALAAGLSPLPATGRTGKPVSG